jgi:hypothetical protein
MNCTDSTNLATPLAACFPQRVPVRSARDDTERAQRIDPTREEDPVFNLIHVGDNQRGLWFRRGQLQDVIMPGSTWLLSWQDKIQIVDVPQNQRFDHPLLDEMIQTAPALRAQLEIVTLDMLQRSIVWQDGKVVEFLGPGRHAFWKTENELTFETFDVPSPFGGRFADSTR